MQITEVRVYIRSEQKLKAFVTVTLENKLVIHNMKIVQGAKNLILCMPSRKGPDGKFRDVVHPITNDLRHEFEQKIFAAYEKEINKLSQDLKGQPSAPGSVSPVDTTGSKTVA